MFTGLVTDVGRVRDMRRGEGGARIVIETAYDVETIEMGASIAVNGAGLEPWLETASLPRSRLVDTSRRFRARPSGVAERVVPRLFTFDVTAQRPNPRRGSTRT